MKRSALLPAVFLTLIFLGCSGEKTKVITFIPLTEKDFNFAADSSYSIPKGKRWDERRKLHDSCMGAEFPANAMFIRTKDTIRLGTIVNRKTMKVIKNLDIPDFASNQFAQLLNIVTKPCYEKGPAHISVDAFFNRRLIIKLPGVNKNINSELNNIIEHSTDNQVETGSWLNAELTGYLGKILDTTKNAGKMEYKKVLLEPDNIILIRSSSITDISFYINSQEPLSSQLQTVLKQKPIAVVENANFRAHLFYIDEYRFEVSFQGIFQVMGQFMQCKLQ